MRCYRRLLIAILALSFALHITNAEAKTVYVRASKGNDSNDGSSVSKAFKTLTRLSRESFINGDTIVIGAGTYDGDFSLSITNQIVTTVTTTTGSSSKKKSSRKKKTTTTTVVSYVYTPANLVADTDGSLTGDKGTVTIKAPAGRPAVSLPSVGSLNLSGLMFTAATSGSGLGILATPSTATQVAVTVTECQFQNLSYGVTARCDSLNLTGCIFSGCATDIYADDTTDVSIDSSTFQHVGNTGIGADMQGDVNAGIADCTFSGCQYGVRCQQTSAVNIDGCDFNGAAYGVVCGNSSDIGISTSNFSNVDYPISGTCSTADIKDCSSTGAEVGVGLNATTTPATITTSSFTGGRYGVVVPAVGYIFSQVSLANNQIGMVIDSATKTLTLSSDMKLDFSGAGIGIYMADNGKSSSSTPSLTMTGLSFTDNTSYAVMSLAGKLSLTSCTMTNCANGVYAGYLSSCQIQKCAFSGGSGWGATISQCDAATVSECTFKNISNGISVRIKGKAKPAFSSLSFDGVQTGLYFDQTAMQLSSSDGITFTNTLIGLSSSKSDVSLTGLNLTGCQYPGVFSEGTLALTNVTTDGGMSGISATGFLQATVSGLTARNSKGWGLTLSGQNISVTDSLADGNQSGFFLNATDGKKTVSLSNITASSNMAHGVMLSQCELASGSGRNIVIANNSGYGLYAYQTPLTLAVDSGVTSTSNGYGIYVEQGDANISGVTLTGNNTGLAVVSGKLTGTDTVINGGSIGVLHSSGAATTLSRLTIRNTTGWGVSISNSSGVPIQAALSNLTLDKNANGIVINGAGGGTASVSNSSITNATSTGISAITTSVTVSDSTIQNCLAAGVAAQQCPSLTVDNCKIEGTSQGYGVSSTRTSGGAASTMIVKRSRLKGNQGGISAIELTQTQVLNNVISKGTYGVTLTNSVPGVWNNTFVDNTIGISYSGTVGAIRNNIIAMNDHNASLVNAFGVYVTSGTLTHGNNLLFGQTRKYVGVSAGTSDVLKPPRFVDYANGDFRLAAGSPAINAGTDPGGLITTDIDGQSRPMFRGYEIGASEYAQAAGSVRVLDWREQASNK